jgi:oligosaccharide repeat unit polymerase
MKYTATLDPYHAPARARAMPQPRSLSHVSKPEWVLSSSCVLASLLGFVSKTDRDIAIVAGILFLLAGLQAVAAFRQSLRSGVLGRSLLAGAILVAFYGEAFVSSMQTPSFRMPFQAPVGFTQFSIDLVQRGLFYVALFHLALLVGYSLRFPRTAKIFDVANREDTNPDYVRVILYCFAVCAFVPLVVTYGPNPSVIVDALISARHGVRNVATNDAGLIWNLSSLGLFGSAALFVNSFFSSLRLRLLDFLVGLVAIAPTIASGTRYRLLYVALPVLIIAFSRLVSRRHYGRLALICAAGVLTLVLFQVQTAVRLAGWNHLFEVKYDALLALKPTLQFDSFLFALYLVPNQHPYFMEPMTPYFFTHWIPRKIWPEKPEPKSLDYYSTMWTRGAKLEVFNVTPSIMGQYYLSWGLFGVVGIGVWIGFLTYLVDEFAFRIHLWRQLLVTVTVGMAYAFILSSLRFYGPIYFVHVAIGTVAMFFLTRRMPSPATTAQRPHLTFASGALRPPQPTFEHKYDQYFSSIRRP